MLRVNSEICEQSNDDYKTMKTVLNYDSDTHLCMKTKTIILKTLRKHYVTKRPFNENPEN